MMCGRINRRLMATGEGAQAGGRVPMAANGVNHASFRAGRSASAGDPILASKVTAPSLPHWAVRRPRITELIASGTRWCPLTVVTGPPGAGKTLAMASWAAEVTGPVAWVCLDEFD